MSSNCLIAFGLMGASLYTIISTQFFNKSKFEESLDDDQKKIYHKIVRERVKLCLQGLVLGIVISVCYLYFTYEHIDVTKNACLVGAISLIVQYLFYMMSPKPDYMIKHLKQDQIDGWVKEHNNMKYKFHLGMILGVIGYLALSLDLFSCGHKEPDFEMIVFSPMSSPNRLPFRSPMRRPTRLSSPMIPL